MIVQCPACSARYRIKPEKLPAGGGKITCPRCSHRFFVKPEEGEASAAAAPAAAGPAKTSRTLALSGIDFSAALAAAQQKAVGGEDAAGGGGSAGPSAAKAEEEAAQLAEIFRSQTEGDALDAIFSRAGVETTEGGEDDWASSLPPELASMVSAGTGGGAPPPAALAADDAGEDDAMSRFEALLGGDDDAHPLPSASAGPGVDDELQRLLEETASSLPESEASGDASESVLPTSAPAPAAPGDGKPLKWKAKTAVGLVFDFANTEGIRTWLGAKDSFDGIQLSTDSGTTWQPVSAFSVLADVRPRIAQRSTREMVPIEPPKEEPAKAGSPAKAAAAGKASGRTPKVSGAARKVPQREVKLDFEPKPQADSKRGLALLFVFVAIALGIVAAALTGIIDLPWMERPAVVEDAPPAPRSDNGARAPQRAERPDPEAGQAAAGRPTSMETAALELIMRAESRRAEGDNAGAIELLQQAQQVAPAMARPVCLLAQLYAQVEGAEAQAAEAEQRCTRLQNPAQGDNEEDEDGP